jgi:multiple sugar transport system permease protein
MSRKRITIEKGVSFLILTLFALVYLVPMVWVFLSAFKSDVELNKAGGFLLFPKTWTLDNFYVVLSPSNVKTPIYRWFMNSVFVSTVFSVLSILISFMSAYAYSKLRFKGRDSLFLVVLFASSFPAIMNIVPLYKIMQILGWINTPWALIVPGLVGTFNIFLAKQFMIGIPDSILEAAKIEGAGDIRVFFQMVIPLSAPILLVVGIFSFTSIWNDFLWPSIIINDVNGLTLTAGLKLARGTYETYVSKISAISVVAIAPMILLYGFAEKWLIRGVSISAGVKG